MEGEIDERWGWAARGQRVDDEPRSKAYSEQRNDGQQSWYEFTEYGGAKL